MSFDLGATFVDRVNFSSIVSQEGMQQSSTFIQSKHPVITVLVAIILTVF